MFNVAIIGAGITGLTVAHMLKDSAKTFIFEKARGVSGRMSTRYAKPYFFDHGAQYFTARTKSFQDFILPLKDKGIIERWNARCVKFDSNKIIEKKNWIYDEPRYVGVPGMNNVARYLAQGLNVYVNSKIVFLERNEKWKLCDENGRQYHDFDWVISTVPSVQVEQTLPKFFKYQKEIRSIKMCASFALMLGFEKNLPLDFDVAFVTNSDLSWISVNSSKPGRENYYTIIAHSSNTFAETHFYEDSQKIMHHLISETSRIIGYDLSGANYKTIHSWKYANNLKKKDCPVFLDKKNKLAACGDWCLGGRVEGGFTSAKNLVTAIKSEVF